MGLPDPRAHVGEGGRADRAEHVADGEPAEGVVRVAGLRAPALRSDEPEWALVRDDQGVLGDLRSGALLVRRFVQWLRSVNPSRVASGTTGPPGLFRAGLFRNAS